jgi:hypothetical protein
MNQPLKKRKGFVVRMQTTFSKGKQKIEKLGSPSKNGPNLKKPIN